MKNHQRYYLHRRVKTFAKLVLVDGKKRIISLNQNYELTPIQKKYLEQLKAVGYSVQLSF